MFQWVIHLLVDPIILLLAARLMSGIEVESSSTATVIACIIGIFSFFLSWSLNAVLVLADLGIFYFLSIGFITRIIAFTIIIQVAKKISDDFRTRNFWTSSWLAVIIAIAAGITDAIIF
ncbi:phage holin family protein [Gramella jeungdoensis]|uniref:Phage holin family protein n=1 Tax=Gramella jeungdoensis TaxID=708091 RepID=A0ABT0YXR7_9FLAO|nr:phage holin family protein [Gramella jeungdoensis]MCM8568266.1 phage holin family protein [Gramella jeungdoensis]